MNVTLEMESQKEGNREGGKRGKGRGMREREGKRNEGFERSAQGFFGVFFVVVLFV